MKPSKSYENISIDRCRARGCCWDDGAGSNVPWCFHGKRRRSEFNKKADFPVLFWCK